MKTCYNTSTSDLPKRINDKHGKNKRKLIREMCTYRGFMCSLNHYTLYIFQLWHQYRDYYVVNLHKISIMVSHLLLHPCWFINYVI